jgi:hypothetical protein
VATVGADSMVPHSDIVVDNRAVQAACCEEIVVPGQGLNCVLVYSFQGSYLKTKSNLSEKKIKKITKEIERTLKIFTQEC